MAADRFTKVPHWLLDDSDLSLHELAVYLVLLRFRDPKNGTCFPGISTIADRARVSRKTVERVIPKLEERGIIDVKRRSSLKVNVPNEYTVRVARPDARFAVSDSSKGKRIPTRLRPTDSESHTNDKESVGKGKKLQPSFAPTDSESVGTDSESLPPQTQSRPKKTQVKKTHQEDVTPNFASEVGRDLSSDWAIPSSELFTDETHESRATAAQISYLTDLVLHLHHEQPSEENLSRWRRLTPEQADQAIRGYKKALGRPDEILYPEHGSEAFGLLSPTGKEFAESAGMPDSVN